MKESKGRKIWVRYLIRLMVITMLVSSIPIQAKAEETPHPVPPPVSQKTTIESKSSDANSNLDTAKSQNEKKPIEIIEQRTEKEKVFDNQDGTYTKKIYQVPVHIRKNGKWEEISTELEDVPSKTVISPKKTELDISYQKKIKDGKYAQIRRDGHEVTYTLLEAQGEKPAIKVRDVKVETEKNKIFYKEIFPHIDLRGSVFNKTVKEDLILKQYTGHHVFRYELQTDLTPELKDDGSIIFYDQDKKQVFNIPRPFMVDSNINPESGEAARSDDVKYNIEKKDSNVYILTLSANQDWLKDPKRIYPVYIDPTTEWTDIWEDAYVSDRYPSQNYSGGNLWDPNLGYYTMKVGYYDGTTGTNWAYLKTNMSRFKGAIIHDAKVKVYVKHHYYTNTPNGLWLDVVSGAWTPSSITWNNKPGSFSNPNTSVVNVTRNQWAEFNVTQAVQNWANDTWGSYGFKLHTNGNGTTYWKKIVASEDYENPPVIEVTYSYPKPNLPRLTAYSHGAGSGTGYIDLSWDAVPGAKEYQIAVFNGKEYQYYWAGTGTSWSTKNMKIWPRKDEVEKGQYSLHTDGQGAEFPVYPAQTYANAGGAQNFNGYKFKLKVGYEDYRGIESDEKTVYMPLEQMQKPFGSAYTNVTGNNGYISVGWKPVPGATGYKVWIFNGKDYEAFDVGNVTTWTTQNQNIWPTDAEIAQGRYLLHHDKAGTEFSTDPSPVYRNSGGPFGSNKNYWFNVTAYSTTHLESKISDPFEPILTTTSLLGVQDYWTTIPVIGGSVTAFNGNFVMDETDFQLDGRGPGVSINHTYNSQDTSLGLFGTGWFSSIEEKVKEETNGNILLTEEDKGTILFTKIGTNQYQAPNGIYLEVKKTSSGFEIKDKDQSVTFFSLGGKKQYEKDTYRNQVTYTYDTTGKLTSIKDASGRTFVLAYTGAHVSKITGPDNRVITFEYDGDNLIASTTPQGKKYRYGYENGKLRYTYDPKHTDANPYKTTYTYEGNKLVQVTDPLGKITKLTYNDTAKEVTLIDPKGVKDVYSYTTAGNPLKTVVDADGLKLTTTYEYQANNLTKKTNPKDQGIRVSETYTYDAKGNVTSAQDAVGKETYAYNSTNDVTKAIDAEGKQTSITYNSASDAVSAAHQQAKTASVTQYDSVGNLTAGSASLAPGANLLTNASFEDAPTNGIPGWVGEVVNNHADASTYTLSSFITAPGLGGGKQALQLGVKPTAGGWGTIQATQIVSANPNQTYTLSGLIQTQNVNDAQAFFEVALLNAQGQPTHIQGRYNELTGTKNWTKRQLTFKTLPDTTRIKVYMVLSHNSINSTGLAWFDKVQLEEGPVSTSFNPVINSSFERLENGSGPPIGWLRSSVNPGQVDTGFQGNNSVILKRNSVTDPDQHYLNVVDVNQTVAKDLTVTAMSKADNVKNADGKQVDDEYGVWVYAHYADGSKKEFRMPFPMGTKDWNRGAITVPAEQPITQVWIYLLFRNRNTGTVWYDDIRVMEENVLTKQEYNTNGYVTAVYDEKGNKTAFTYDIYGNKKTETDPMTYTKLYEYNLDNYLTKTTLPNGTSVGYKYDDNSNVTEKTITAGTSTQTVKYEYDVDNKLTVFQDALLRKIFYTYDANANLISTKMPNGGLLEWTYDAASRVTQVKRNGQAAFSYQYDANGNETKVIDSVNSITRDKAYDAGDRITSMTDRGGTVAWSYYPNSYKLKETKITQGAYGNTTSYEYDVLNQNTKVLDGGQSYYFEYDEFGNVVRYQSGNDTFALSTYDNTQKVTDLYIGTKNSTPILTEKYEYDKNSNLKSIERTAGTTKQTISYEYDSVNQLKKETLVDNKIKEYTYDGFGNRKTVTVTSPSGTATTTTAQFNTGNQLVKFGSETLTYDANGNRTSDGKYTYTWNEADQLVAITNKGQSAPFATYKYDDDGRRIEKTVNGQVTRYHYNGESINVLYETDTNGNVLRQYVYSVDGVRLAMKTQGQTFYYHYNPHGDVVAMTDQNNVIVAQYEYDAWGNLLKRNEQGLTADNPFTYAGYMTDEETGLYYLMARYYHPKHGVFLSIDPDPGDKDDPITQNGYNYANNNPVMMVDPDGNHPVLVFIAVVVAKVAVKYVAKAVKKVIPRIVKVIKDETGAVNINKGANKGLASRGYKPRPGERTFNGFVNNNVPKTKETKLYTNSSGFNNVGSSGGQFKRFGTDSHAGIAPHVHKPMRNLYNGNIRGGVGTKTKNGGVTSPTWHDVKQLYDYLYNGKYR